MNATPYIPREIEDVLLRSSKTFPAVAVTGPRQAGKTTLLQHLFGNSHQFVSFDDPLNRERASTDPRLFLESLREQVIFDEIQYVPQLLSYIKIAIDSRRHEYGRYLFTGSQQFHLIKDLGDTLAGRIALLNLLPFSLSELRAAFADSSMKMRSKDWFVQACLRGTFPEIVLQPELDTRLWYGSYLQTYLERDVRTLANVGDLRSFQQCLRLLAARCAQILNLSEISNELGVAVNTVKRWISILQASHILFLLPAYYRNLGKRIVKSPKIYFLDVGLVCYLTGVQTEEHLFHGPLAGPLFENFVIQEVVKCYFNQGRRADHLFYLRTSNRLEVDLLIEEHQHIWPVEIKLSSTPNVGMAKTIERFKNLFPKLDIRPGYLVSLSDEKTPLTQNVTSVPLPALLQMIKD